MRVNRRQIEDEAAGNRDKPELKKLGYDLQNTNNIAVDRRCLCHGVLVVLIKAGNATVWINGAVEAGSDDLTLEVENQDEYDGRARLC
jgi:hypothetical protein